MGGQGILLRKVTLDKTLNQLQIFLKGALMILLMYLINGLFLEKNFKASDIQLLAALYLAVFLGFLFLRRKKKFSKDSVLVDAIKQYFEIAEFSDIEKLDKELIKEIKNNRRFVTNKGQVVGTESFLLFDLIDGQFKLIPVKCIQKMTVRSVDNQYYVQIETSVQAEKFSSKERKKPRS
ncbi:hypothetical protein [Candidatus Enterococcus ferrettii]|uniref:DUF421 domain-containing protein n=1 Tax=Candidatus Enterococcus ferrettii TaxID=2815324 RepID=A0ABV0EK14_9ENTE|nr:hypothetical protein [Enterococcus sp. 665A]